jgi:transposase
METIKIDNDFSYLVGLMQTDGSLSETTRNRGKL